MLSGLLHWGEYPLCFAVCLNQEECVRLLVARGAQLDLQDSNGNTALHMAVIYNRLEMFDLVHSLGASLSLKNNRGMLALASSLIFF